MTRNVAYGKYVLWLILFYGLLITVWNLNYNSVFIDEAYHITMGHQLLRGEPCSGCPYATGSVSIHPVIAAYGDSIAGIYGARVVNIIFGLGLTVIIYLTARLLFGERLGLITAVLFLCSGQTLYLMKLATYDMIAAFFLGFAFLMIVASEKVGSGKYQNLALVMGTTALFLACVTKYLVPVFIPFLLLYIFIKHGASKTVLYTIIPLAIFTLLYISFAPYPPPGELVNVVDQVRTDTHIPFRTLADWTFRWVAMAYLLAVFGLFHEEKGKTALQLIIFSTPIIIVHLVTQSEQSVNKNMIFSLVFLAPAAALGVDYIGKLFSMRSSSRVVRGFFTVAVLVIFWTYGLFNLRWLEKQYPDVSPVIEYFKENGFDGMTVAMNGWDGVIYTYELGDQYPDAQFIHITQAIKTGNPGHSFHEKVDFIVCEDLYYGMLYPCEEFHDYIENDYTLLENFTIAHSWGVTDAKIFGRK